VANRHHAIHQKKAFVFGPVVTSAFFEIHLQKKET
jgi:hypothetical protein